MKNLYNWILVFILPRQDKLTHFYLWSMFLAFNLSITNYYSLSSYLAYGLTILSAIIWEAYQKIFQKGTNSPWEMTKDIFFGGILTSVLHLIPTFFIN